MLVLSRSGLWQKGCFRFDAVGHGVVGSGFGVCGSKILKCRSSVARSDFVPGLVTHLLLTLGDKVELDFGLGPIH